MRYFFILGTNPVLSTAEIIALLDGRFFTVTEMYKQALIVDAAPGQVLDAKALMSRLGGTIKIGELFGDIAPEEDAFVELMASNLDARPTEKPITFGFSFYSLESDAPANKAAALAGRFRNAGMEVKGRLKEAGKSARWVKAQVGAALSSVVVGKNKMIDEGAEFVVMAKKDRFLIGKTTVIQPFEEFSKVDYGRPERDLEQGMLPPKLARIMINLIHVSREVKEVALLDPFCGSGTILTEALQMGFGDVHGSDRNPAAVEATKKNIDWVKSKGLAPAESSANVVVSDAREINKQLKENSIDAIVTETYLGPPRTGREKRGEMQKTLYDLTTLYGQSLGVWKKILKPGAPVVIAFPVYIVGLEKHGITIADFKQLGFVPEPLLPASILSRLGVRETKNHGLMYGRNDQYVWREIVRLRLADAE